MKNFEEIIRDNDLLIEAWWEPDDEEFRAVVRNDEVDDGWAGSADNMNDAILLAISTFETDRLNEQVKD